MFLVSIYQPLNDLIFLSQLLQGRTNLLKALFDQFLIVAIRLLKMVVIVSARAAISTTLGTRKTRSLTQ